MTLGGRAAEDLVFHEVTTGASNDLEKVTDTAKRMVMRYGMSDKLGPRVLGRNARHAVPRPRDGPRARLLRRARPRDRRRGAPDHRGGLRARAEGAARAHGGAAPDLADPDRARDDRQGSVRAPARRRDRGRRCSSAEREDAAARAGAEGPDARAAPSRARSRCPGRRCSRPSPKARTSPLGENPA